MTKKVAQQTDDARALVFADGSSNKFWNIQLDGTSHTVSYGRVGTTGQTQTKEFASEEAARKSFDKLVAQKLKKGYVDADGKSSSPAGAASQSNGKTRGKKATAAQPPVEPMPLPEAPPIDVDLQVTREIDLDPEDWLCAGFRPRKPLERGEPVEFDKEACLKRLAKLKTTNSGWVVRWDALKLPPALSREEAHFWLIAMTEPRARDLPMKVLAERVNEKTIDGRVDLETAQQLLDRTHGRLAPDATLPLSNLLSPTEYLDLIGKEPAGRRNTWEAADRQNVLIDGFRQHVVPYLTNEERKSVHNHLRKNWDPTQEPSAVTDGFPPEYYLAAAMGMHEEIYEVTSRWADDRYQSNPYRTHYERPQDLVFGLGSPELVEGEWRRLKLRMRSPDDIRAFLACTEFAALDCVADSIIAQTNKDECDAFLRTFALVRAPEAAEPMLRCKLSAKMPVAAREWLDRNVGNAVAGLIDVAGRSGKVAEAAIDYLRSVNRRGYEAVIDECVRGAGESEGAATVQAEVLDYEEKVYEPLDSKSTPKWLQKGLEAVTGRPKRLPAWVNPALLPPLVVGERRLNDQQVLILIQLLAATPISEAHPMFEALRENVSPSVRDEFAWALFQLWQEDGYPPKEKWAMGAIGHLGGDGCVLKLTPLIRVWPGESQHARAVFGLECLRAVGSNLALMQLSGIGQKLKFKGLKAKARQFVEDIAKEKGMTRNDLEDRVVPDCGLDENGRREFSFGPRSFSFVLGSDLKAMVRDEAGKIRANLPKPGVKDDERLAAEATAEWKLLKKQIKEVATIQAGRLEQAMVTGRQWNLDDFETLLVRHPLMTHLAQKVIWGGFDSQRKRQVTFRVTEERDYAGPDDNTIALEKVTKVGIVHPLELTDTERSQWGEVMSDYEIMPPFPQLGRAVYALEDGEGDTDDMQRFRGLKLAAPTLVFTLEKLGWVRGEAMDAGCFDEHSKQFPTGDVTAVIGYEGTVGMGYIDPDELLTIDTVHFCPGMRAPSGYGWGTNKKLKLSKVPPIVLSEVIADLQVLKSKAK